MQFSEIKSLKRVHKVNEGIGTENITEIPGIVNPYTGEIMTVRGAIASRILDVRTGKIVATPDGLQISIDEAVRRGLIDPKIAERLFSPCGVMEDGRNLNLLEAIQREIYEAEQGFLDPSEKRLKVTHSTTINQAIDDGTVDLNTGSYRLDSGESITITEAYQRGYLVQQREVKLKTGAICLYDAISQGLIDEKTGWILDRTSGNKYQIDAAIKSNVVDGDVKEIVDPKVDNKITVVQALETGVINPKLGKYVLPFGKLSFSEAKSRHLIIKPMTLKDVVDSELIDNEGKIKFPERQSRLTILEAVARGVIDSDSVKSIFDSSINEYITLNEAIAKGIILPHGAFKDALTGEIISIPEAVHRGYIISIVQKSIFDIDGFQSPEKPGFISFNVATSKGFISKRNGGSLLTDIQTGKLISFADGAISGEVKSEVYEILTRKIGIVENGVELSVLEAVFKGYIDPCSGNFVDIRENKVVPLNDAIAQNLITAEGAALLNSLLTINVKTHTTSKIVQRYVTVAKSEESLPYSTMTYTEALQKGLIDNKSQTFVDPTSNTTIPLTQALNEGKIRPDSAGINKVEDPEDIRVDNNQAENLSSDRIKTTLKLIQLQSQNMETDNSTGYLTLSTSNKLPTLYTETKLIERDNEKAATAEFITAEKCSSAEKQVYELPSDGWLLADAIAQSLFDPVAGLFIIPGTDRLVSFEECVHLKIISPLSAVVVDPANKRKISLTKSLDRKILDATGHYILDNAKINMKEAIEKGYVILEDKMEVEPSSEQPIEVATVTHQDVADFAEIKGSKEVLFNLEPIQLEPGVIFDPISCLIIYPNENKSENLIEAVRTNRISSKLLTVRDPTSGEEISFDEALRTNILDPSTGEYQDKSGNKISLANAIKCGILSVAGSPLTGTQRFVKFVHKIVDPQTSEALSLEEALEKKIITEEDYRMLKPESTSADVAEITYPDLPEGHVEAAKSIEDLIKHSATIQPVKFLDTTTIDLDEDLAPSPGQRARVRITVEPKYTVVIGRCQSVSPEREPKKVVLQKLRRKIVKPSDAVEKGIIDEAVANLLDKKVNSTQVLKEGDKESTGRIIDPQHGHSLTINEAIARGILDPVNTDEILLPLNRSLSIPELYEQGLIDPATGKVVHPETGLSLTLKEAVVCDVLDPLSTMVTASGQKITLQEALQAGIIDENNAKIQTSDGTVDLDTAVRSNVFDKESSPGCDLPPAGMTFEVALKRGLIDPNSKEITHPITGTRVALADAIKENFIMSIPFPASENSINVIDALNDDLIDCNAATFKNPKTGAVKPISEAIETGELIIKHPDESLSTIQSVTTSSDTVTTLHTVTTKTLSILRGYALKDANTVENVSTGERMTVEEARSTGIIVEEMEVQNTTALTFTEAIDKGLVHLESGTYTDPKSGKEMTIQDALTTGILTTDISTEQQEDSTANLAESAEVLSISKIVETVENEEISFKEALEKNIIDPKSVVYDISSKSTLTLEKAVEEGIIDAKTGNVKDKSSGKNINLKEAAKKGLIAIVGTLAAPVALPVIAAASVIDKVKNRKESQKLVEKPQEKHTVKSDVTPKQQKESVAKEYNKQNVNVEQYHKKPVMITDVVRTEIVPSASEAVVSVEQIVAVDEISFEQMQISEAISNSRIVPKVCRVMYKKRELPYTVQDGIEQGKLKPNSIIEIVNKNLVNLVDKEPEFLRISKEITPQKMADLGYYDLRSYAFVDPETLERISFEDFTYTAGVFNPDNILVRDITKKGQVYVSLHEAVRRPLINAQSGYMVDPKTGKRVPFFEAVKIKWIIDVADKPKTKQKPLSFEEAVASNKISAKSMEVTVPETNEVVPFAEALDRNVISPQTITIRDPKNLEIIPYYDAVDQNIVDLQKGVIVNTATQNLVEFADAFEKGYILALPRPISLEAVIHKGMYDIDTCKIADPLTHQLIPLGEAVGRQIIDQNISEVKDTKADQFVTLGTALGSRLVDPDNGKLRDTQSGELLPLNIAFNQNLIQTKPLVLNLLQAIISNYYSPTTGLILNPTTGNEISLSEAIESKLIDPTTTRIKDEGRQKIVEINEAIERNLVDPEKGVLTTPLLTLDEAYAKGYILSTVVPWSLQQAVALKLYDPKNGQFILDDTSRTLAETIDENIINPNVLTIKDPRSSEVVTLNEAIACKLIDPQKGVVVDPISSNEINFYDATERGLLVPYKNQITLPEAVFRGFYNPTTGEFLNPTTKAKMVTSKALNRGYIDPSTTVVVLKDELVPFNQAILEGHVDTNDGKLIVDKDKVDFLEAFELGKLIEVNLPMHLSEAIARGIFDPDTQLFLNPQTGEYLTLIEAIEANIIDPGSVHVKDTRTGVWRKLTLVEAIDNGYVDRNTGKVKDFSKGESYEVSLIEAFNLGILVDNKVAVSLQRAIHQGLYVEATGKIIDPNTERKVTLHEAIRKFVINPLLPCYFNKKEGKLLNLTDTCRFDIIDKRNGVFKDPLTNSVFSLNEALNLGLIIDIETANFGLYEALEMNLFDRDENVFEHPATSQKYNLKDAYSIELINPISSIIKDIKANKYLALVEAVKNNTIDDKLNIYKLPNGTSIDLITAKQRGLIVTARRMITLEEAIQNCLYKPDSGKFVDPLNGEYYSLTEALANGFIDPASTGFKDPTNNSIKSLNAAIFDGNIDVDKGRVLDPKNKKTYNYDVAFEKELLITLDKPLVEDIIQKTPAQASASRPAHECSLEEAIKFELVKPDVAVIKNPETGKFKSVIEAVNSKQLDVRKLIVFDPAIGKTRSKIANYNQELSIYQEEPLTFEKAVELNRLNVSTGQFVDPETTEVLTIKDSISLGFIDPDSALVKDASKKKLLKLPEAFRKGLADAEKGNVLDSSTSKLYSLSDAIDKGLLTTPRRGFGLIEAINYGLYNPTTGGFHDPFTVTSVINKKRLTLSDAIDENLVDPSTTVVKDPESGAVVPLLTAIENKLIEPQSGRMLSKNEGLDIDLQKALEKGLIMPAEQRVSLFYLIFCLPAFDCTLMIAVKFPF